MQCLKKYRLLHRWTQERLARHCGVGQTTIAAWEQGRVLPPIWRYIQLIRLLQIPPTKLLRDLLEEFPRDRIDTMQRLVSNRAIKPHKITRHPRDRKQVKRSYSYSDFSEAREVEEPKESPCRDNGIE